MASLSVIIPAYNAGVFLDETIQSVVHQYYPADEIIVIDDGSTDETADVVRRWIAKDQRIQLVQQLNQGVSAARNFGFRISRGDIVAFLDSDDVWSPIFTERGMKTIGDSCDVFVAASRRFQKIPGDAPSPFQLNDDYVRRFPHSLVKENVIVPSMVMMKRRLIERFGGFADDQCMWEDWDLWLRFVTNGAKFSFDTSPGLVHYRVSPESRSSVYALGCDRCIGTLKHHLNCAFAPQFLVCRQISWWLRQRGNIEESGSDARSFYWQSLQYDPWAWKSWVKWLWSFLR